MKSWKDLLGYLLSLTFCAVVFAAPTPEGNWISPDESTGEKRAILHLTVNDGELRGTVKEVFPLPGDTGICSKCPGNFKDKPIKGLEIIWGLREISPGIWEGGKVLDAKSGKLYHLKVTIKDNDKLHVRGYIGFSMIGRTQIWRRAEAGA